LGSRGRQTFTLGSQGRQLRLLLCLAKIGHGLFGDAPAIRGLRRGVRAVP
jgi:hypothetical protein